MSKELEKIKTIIKYLNRVCKSEEVGLMDQDFFLTTEELKRLIDNYYLGFNNQKELNEELIFRYNSISKLKFEEGVGFGYKSNPLISLNSRQELRFFVSLLTQFWH